MLLPVAISNEGLPHALRAIVLIPPAMIFAALGLEFIINKFGNLNFENWKLFGNWELKIGNCRQWVAKTLLLTFFLATAAHAFNTYFLRWAPNYNVYQAFQADITEKAHWLKTQPQDIKKFVVTGDADVVDVRGTPMSLQPVIFITNTFFEKDQKEKNIYYRTAQTGRPGSSVLSIDDCDKACIIIPAETNPLLFHAIKQKIPTLHLYAGPGFVMLRKN